MTALLRLPGVIERVGLQRSTIYTRIREGLFPHPVKLGARASAWPAHEVDACNDAVIRGKSEDEIRALVQELHAKRQN